MKQLIGTYSFSTSGKTITLGDFTTVRLDRLQLITDVTTNKILYNFADSTVATATVATNVITLSVLQGGENNTDKLEVVYDCVTGDPTYDTPVLPNGAATAAKQPSLGTAGSASSNVLTVQGIASMTALKTDASATTQPVSAASLPLPTGAATAAKQPALGTAGSASSDVITVQGVASMTALKVDASATTQPVSGTVTANAGTGTFAVSATSLPHSISTTNSAILKP